jgi:hypothetical protein
LKKENNHIVIDSPTKDAPEQSVIKEMIMWWEKRRIIYNILIVGLSIFLIYDFWDYPWRKIVGGNIIIFEAVLFLIIANVFYSLGWGIGVLAHYMFKTNGLSITWRWIIFVLGTLFSIIITDLYFVFAFDVLFA